MIKDNNMQELTSIFVSDLAEIANPLCIIIGGSFLQLLKGERKSFRYIEEIDFFLIQETIDVTGFDQLKSKWDDLIENWKLHIAAVNGPYRTKYPDTPTLNIHLLLWDPSYIRKVSKFVLKSIKSSMIVFGKLPQEVFREIILDTRGVIYDKFSINWCINALLSERFSLKTWLIDSELFYGKEISYNIVNTYEKIELVYYSLWTTIKNIEYLNVPESVLPSNTDELFKDLKEATFSARNGNIPDSDTTRNFQHEVIKILSLVKSSILAIL